MPANVLSIEVTTLFKDIGGGLNKASAALQGFLDRNRTLGDVAQNVKKSISGIAPEAALAVGGITALGAALTASVFKAAAVGDQFQTLSERTGVSTEALSQLKFAVEQSGSSLEALTPAFRTLSRNVGSAVRGNKAAISSFKDLGIGVDDLGKPLDELFGLVADGVKATENATLGAARAGRVIGGAATSLLPLLRGGSSAIDELRQRADRLGLTISSDFARRADEFNDNMAAIRTALQGAVVQIGSQLLPTFANFAQQVVDFAEQNGPQFVRFIQQVVFDIRNLVLDIERFQLNLKGIILLLNKRRTGATGVRELAEINERLTQINSQLAQTFEQFIAPGELLTHIPKIFADLPDPIEKVLPPLAQLAELLQEAFEKAEGGVGAITALANSFLELRGPEAAAGLEKINSELDKAIAKGGLLAEQAKLAKDAIAAAVGIVGPAIPADLLAERRAEQITRETTPGFSEFIGPLEQTEDKLEEISNVGQATIGELASGISGIGGLFVDAAASGAAAFGSFFKGLLASIARAIVQALIFKAIIGATGGPLGFFGRLFKPFETPGFDAFAASEGERFGMLFGRGARAAALATTFGGIGAAEAPTAQTTVSVTPQIRVIDAGPLAKVEFFERGQEQRLRRRQQELGGEPL